MKIETTLTYEQFKERFEQHVMPENSYKYKYRKQIYFLGTLSDGDMSIRCFMPHQSCTGNGITGKVVEEMGKCTITYKMNRPDWVHQLGVIMMWIPPVSAVHLLAAFGVTMGIFPSIYRNDTFINALATLFIIVGIGGIFLPCLGYVLGILSKKEGECCRAELEDIINNGPVKNDFKRPDKKDMFQERILEIIFSIIVFAIIILFEIFF
ncbi:MAG: hypothetical protein HDR01_01455 [Lachnospiraceae bacterium]|nr:hypothetical protein [Lachnospiraceae bacterium]